jgi:hypothetical protein
MPGDIVTDADFHGELPKLIDDGINNNYGDWWKKSYLQLLSWDLWKYVEGPESIPPEIPTLRQTTSHEGYDVDGSNSRVYYHPGNKDEFEQKTKQARPWMAANNITLARIGRAVPGDQFHIVDHIRYAKEAWQSLYDHYQPRNSLRSSSLRTSILKNRCTLEMDLSIWLGDMQRSYNMLCDMAPESLSQQVFTLAVLDNMPPDPSWLEFVCKLKNKVQKYDQSIPPIPIDSKYFLSRIREQYWLRMTNSSQINSHIFAAGTESDKKTSKCPRVPDIATPGPSKRARLTNDKSCSNPNCARKGHLFAECITFGGGNQGVYPPWWKGPWNLHISSELRTRANNVPPASHPAYARLSATAHAAVVTTHDSTRAATSAHIDSTDDDAQVHAVLKQETPTHIWHAHIDDDDIIATLPVFDDNMPKADSCYYDTGATRHVFNDQTAFETYEKISPVPVKGFSHHISASAVGRGSIRLQSQYGNQTSSIILSQALHIPAARSNLVSGTLLAKAGVSATLEGNLVTLSHGGIKLIEGVMHNGMYNLNVSIIRPLVQPSLLSRITSSPSSINSASTSSAPEGFYTALWDT